MEKMKFPLPQSVQELPDSIEARLDLARMATREWGLALRKLLAWHGPPEIDPEAQRLLQEEFGPRPENGRASGSNPFAA